MVVFAFFLACGALMTSAQDEECYSFELDCDDGGCVYEWAFCDGINDCLDDSDEDPGCIPTGCGPDEFQCVFGDECIPNYQVCDGEDDCSLGTDEECGGDCGEDEWECDNGMCIYETDYCNREIDCGDGSDEPDPCWECPDDEWECDNGACIYDFWHCDGREHCADGTDESGCTPEDCDDREWKCENGGCIGDIYYCDEHEDCADDSDEPEGCVYGEMISDECVKANLVDDFPEKSGTEKFKDANEDCVDLTDFEDGPFVCDIGLDAYKNSCKEHGIMCTSRLTSDQKDDESEDCEKLGVTSYSCVPDICTEGDFIDDASADGEELFEFLELYFMEEHGLNCDLDLEIICAAHPQEIKWFIVILSAIVAVMC